MAEVKKLQLQVARSNIKGTANGNGNKELEKLKASLGEMEKENTQLKANIKKLVEDPVDSLSPRTPKVYSDTKTKLQLKVKRHLLNLRSINHLKFKYFRK